MPLQLEDTVPTLQPKQSQPRRYHRLVLAVAFAMPLLLLAGPVGLSCLRPYQADLGPYSVVAFVRPPDALGRTGYFRYQAGAGDIRQFTLPVGATAWNMRWIRWEGGGNPKGLQFTFVD